MVASKAWNQPIPPDIHVKLLPMEQYICSFLGDWIDFGMGGKKRKGTWVITNMNLHFVGKVGVWDAGTEFGEQVRHISTSDLREVKREGKKIKIYFLKDPSRPDKVSKRGIVLKKVEGESSADVEQRRTQLVGIIQNLIKPPAQYPNY